METGKPRFPLRLGWIECGDTKTFARPSHAATKPKLSWTQLYTFIAITTLETDAQVIFTVARGACIAWPRSNLQAHAPTQPPCTHVGT